MAVSSLPTPPHRSALQIFLCALKGRGEAMPPPPPRPHLQPTFSPPPRFPPALRKAAGGAELLPRRER